MSLMSLINEPICRVCSPDEARGSYLPLRVLSPSPVWVALAYIAATGVAPPPTEAFCDRRVECELLDGLRACTRRGGGKISPGRKRKRGKTRAVSPCRWTLHYHMIGIQLPSPVSAGAPGRDPSVRGEVLHATREARVRAREGGRARETESQSERYTRRPRDHQVRARIRLRERASIVAAGL